MGSGQPRREGHTLAKRIDDLVISNNISILRACVADATPTDFQRRLVAAVRSGVYEPRFREEVAAVMAAVSQAVEEMPPERDALEQLPGETDAEFLQANARRTFPASSGH